MKFRLYFDLISNPKEDDDNQRQIEIELKSSYPTPPAHSPFFPLHLLIYFLICFARFYLFSTCRWDSIVSFRFQLQILHSVSAGNRLGGSGGDHLCRYTQLRLQFRVVTESGQKNLANYSHTRRGTHSNIHTHTLEGHTHARAVCFGSSQNFLGCFLKFFLCFYFLVFAVFLFFFYFLFLFFLFLNLVLGARSKRDRTLRRTTCVCWEIATKSQSENGNFWEAAAAAAARWEREIRSKRQLERERESSTTFAKAARGAYLPVCVRVCVKVSSFVCVCVSECLRKCQIVNKRKCPKELLYTGTGSAQWQRVERVPKGEKRKSFAVDMKVDIGKQLAWNWLTGYTTWLFNCTYRVSVLLGN